MAPSLAAFDTLGPAIVTSGPANAAAYRVARAIAPVPGVPASAPATLRDVAVTVSWRDRAGEAHALAAAHAVRPRRPRASSHAGVAAPASGPGAPVRPARMPPAATDLGDGTSVFKPMASGSVAYVMDNASAAVVRRCSGLPGGSPVAALAASGVRCEAVQAWLVSGLVRARRHEAA
jgi:hypothetical protein